MDKIERLRVSRTEETENKRAQAMQIAVQAYPGLAASLAAAPFSVSISGVVLFYIDPAEYVEIPLTGDSAPRRLASDYGAHIRDGSKSGAPIVGTFEDGKFLRVVEWDGGPFACAFSYDAERGTRARASRTSYRVGHTHKGLFIAPNSRRHYILPPPGDTEAGAHE